MSLIRPKYLKAGDRIAIVSPARKISPAEVEPAIRVFESWGLEVVLGDYLYAATNQFAGTDNERRSDLQQMLDDVTVRAIISSRGGYGSVRIVDQLDFKGFNENPKWIVGYSDATVFHSHIHSRFEIETLHATMPVNFSGKSLNDPSLISLKKALFGEPLNYQFPSHPLNRSGTAKGQIVGGNLSILYSLIGSPSDIDTSGKILFIEDLDEYLYHIDRMMMNLKRTGKLDRLAGLIVGGMTEMNDNEVPYGKNALEIIREAVEECDYPLCFNFPAGHNADNQALILGRNASLEIAETAALKF